MEWRASIQPPTHLQQFQLQCDIGLLGQLSNNKKMFLYYLNLKIENKLMNFY